MKVKINNRMWRMSHREYQGLLKIAREQVPLGYAELRCDKCESITKVKELAREFKKQGFKVYTNGKDQ